MTNKIKIMLTGYNGKMGRSIIETAEDSADLFLAVGIDINPAAINVSFPVFFKPSDYNGELDVILDFSHHSAIDSILEYAIERKIPAVIATTGHTEDEKALIRNAAAIIPVFFSANMSLGINLLVKLVKDAALFLRDGYDIEIIEKHHNQKLDAPSGTALMIAAELSETMPRKPEYVYDRHNERKKRSRDEIGFHSVRGGTIIGEHEVMFAGQDEVLTISHSAITKDMFSRGALEAVRFVYAVKEPGIYNMSDLIN